MNEVGVGTRVLNFLIDTILIFLIAYGVYKWWTFYVTFWGYKYFVFYKVFYATVFVYYSIFEMLWSRTPGKFVSMTKVRNSEGGRPKFYQVLCRSALRLTLIDPIFIGIWGKPLHDKLSKTLVVEI
ncbi:MAG TPA: RDD family protein [Segetibacter sp.]|jgi:uncharacterized RDD family membrane protein YckC